MYLLILIGMIWGISALIRSMKQRRAERIRQAQIARINAENARRKAEIARVREDIRRREAEARAEINRMAAIEREQMRQRKEQEKQAAMLAKHDEEIEKLKFRMAQAEADILAEQNKLDHYTARLSALDEELAKINSDIEYYQLANKVDAEKKAKAEKAKIEDKIFNFEEKVRSCEKRMSKAKFNKEQAERKIA